MCACGTMLYFFFLDTERVRGVGVAVVCVTVVGGRGLSVTRVRGRSVCLEE